MQNERKKYEAPALKEWGNVVDLTQHGGTKDTGDAMGGSVFPPGIYG